MLEADSHNVIVNKDGKEVIVSDLILSKLNLFKNEKAFKQKDKSRRKRKAIEGAGVWNSWELRTFLQDNLELVFERVIHIWPCIQKCDREELNIFSYQSVQRVIYRHPSQVWFTPYRTVLDRYVLWCVVQGLWTWNVRNKSLMLQFKIGLKDLWDFTEILPSLELRLWRTGILLITKSRISQISKSNECTDFLQLYAQF